jgi:ribonuclease P protein component
MRRGDDVRETVRHGRRAGRGTVVVHASPGVPGSPALVGFAVSRGVGNAVVRNKVKRRLRHVMLGLLPELSGARVVVRANPAAAHADWPTLQADVASAVRRCLARLASADQVAPQGSSAATTGTDQARSDVGHV